MHEATCPLGLDLDRLMERDAKFFVDHPGADSYWRKISRVEALELFWTQGVPDMPLSQLHPVGRVLVRQIKPGLRIRSFDRVRFLEPAAVRQDPELEQVWAAWATGEDDWHNDERVYQLADKALETGELQVAVIRGVELVAAPDVILEAAQAGGEVIPDNPNKLVRRDGRWVHFYRMPEAGVS